MGRQNASVFPLPVGAAPTRFRRPRIEAESVAAWIGVGWENPRRASEMQRRSWRKADGDGSEEHTCTSSKRRQGTYLLPWRYSTFAELPAIEWLYR